MAKGSKIEIRIDEDFKKDIKSKCDINNITVSSYIISLIEKDIESTKKDSEEIIRLKEVRNKLLSSCSKNPNSYFFKKRLRNVESEILSKGGKL